MIRIDMVMPENCKECRFRSNKWCYCIPEFESQPTPTDLDKRPDWCPLLPVNAKMPKPAIDDFMKKILDACEKEIQRRVTEHE